MIAWRRSLHLLVLLFISWPVLGGGVRCLCSSPGGITTWEIVAVPSAPVIAAEAGDLAVIAEYQVSPLRGALVPDHNAVEMAGLLVSMGIAPPLHRPLRGPLRGPMFLLQGPCMGDRHYRALLETELKKAASEMEKISAAAQAASDRRAILASTFEAGRVSGSNIYDPEQGRLPWMDFHKTGADYLDATPVHPKTIKPFAAARGHLKSEIGCNGMARHICKHNESRNAVFAGSGDRAGANVSNVAQILQQPRWQAAFPDVLYPPDGRTTDDKKAYQNEALYAKRVGAWREATLEARGILDDTTGMHVGHDGVCWVDDIVTKQNYIDKPSDRIKTVNALIHVLAFIVDPGAQVWLTFTRWGLDDAYATILDPEGMYMRYWCQPDPVVFGCFRVTDSGAVKALYPLKYCVTPEETASPVVLNGEVYKVPRVSLTVLKGGMEPWEWNSQMENNPKPEGSTIFYEEYFDEKQQLPCEAKDLETFLDDATMVRRYIAPPSEADADYLKSDDWLDRGVLIPAISGDPSYGEKQHNDFQVAFNIYQDRFNNWYVLEGYYERKGYKGLEEYLRWIMDGRDRWTVRNALGVEAHGKEALIALADRIAREEHRIPMRWAKLSANSNQKKEIRIARLEPQFRGRRVYWTKTAERFRKLACAEMKDFGVGAKHDDIPDCLSNFMDHEVLRPRSAQHVIKTYNSAKSMYRNRGMSYA